MIIGKRIIWYFYGNKIHNPAISPGFSLIQLILFIKIWPVEYHTVKSISKVADHLVYDTIHKPRSVLLRSDTIFIFKKLLEKITNDTRQNIFVLIVYKISRISLPSKLLFFFLFFTLRQMGAMPTSSKKYLKEIQIIWDERFLFLWIDRNMLKNFPSIDWCQLHKRKTFFILFLSEANVEIAWNYT